MDGLRLRTATTDDAAAVADVYRPYVEETAVTFETTPPATDEVADRIERTLERYPWIVAERDGRVVGYAYAGRLRKRAAYRWAVESSVYVDRDRRGRGVGTALYRALLDALERQGFRSVYGVITLPNTESVAFHERFGFERVGRFPDVGYKFGESHDVGWYERTLGDDGADPGEPTPFDACRDAAWLGTVLSSAVSDATGPTVGDADPESGA